MSARKNMGPVVVVVLPLLELVAEQLGVVDERAVEEPVELLGVDAVGLLDLAVEPGVAGLDVDLLDAPLSITCQWNRVITAVADRFRTSGVAQPSG
jgi:hypothetical protein